MSKGETTRERIVREAAPLFNQKGFAGCSVQDILNATGLEKGGLYRHFASKQELAVEVFRWATAQSQRSRTDGMEHIENAVDRLKFHVARFAEAPSLVAGGCMLLNTAVDADDVNPELKAMACDAIQRWKRRIAAIVEYGMARGEIKAGTTARRVGNTIVATLEGALVISRLEGTKDALEDARESLGVMLEGLRA
ncbi:TetR/AcrR family transcriptional regulator [Granulicella tundricola]|nr:TetR/AcrR family transcriptional regulator [Granulicella tundricola]